ncbi:MAG TPA: TIGR00730 family Rossman fold protein [Hyphomicrobiales bacterium]|nr:TIGR00730 family Rossman fold protein [Hyphomicrobiales bacterium]
MKFIGSVCVYCGSNSGTSPRWEAAAGAFGSLLGESGVRLVYGGGGLGLMGALARGVLAHGGEVTGVIPRFLVRREQMLESVQEHLVTETMHERKQLMFDHADAFVALPGGIGTLEELVEQLTWAQLGRHHKPIAIANLDGYWEPLLAMLAHMRRQGFVRESADVPYVVANSVDDILPKLEEAAARTAERGKTPKETVDAEPLHRM